MYTCSGRGGGFLPHSRRASFITPREMDVRQALLIAVGIHMVSAVDSWMDRNAIYTSPPTRTSNMQVLTIGFAVPSFILARVQAGGFNAVLTALILLLYNGALFPLLLQPNLKDKDRQRQPPHQHQDQQPLRATLSPLLVSV